MSIFDSTVNPRKIFNKHLNTKLMIQKIDGDLLKAILAGGRVAFHKTRTNETTGVSAHVVIIEMPKGVFLNSDDKHWKFLIFLNTPDIDHWWHASSNNLTKRQNMKKVWEEWSELKYHVQR